MVKMSLVNNSALDVLNMIFVYGFVLSFSGVVLAEVVLSPSNLHVRENTSLTFTCTYAGIETVISFTWKRIKAGETVFSNIGLITAECNAIILPIDNNLYEYGCPSSKQYTWTIKRVTGHDEGDKYQCDVETPSPGIINSNRVTIYLYVPVADVTLKYGISKPPETLEVTNGVPKTLTCIASKSRPSATIIWYIGDDVKKKENVTMSTFQFTPGYSDHNKQVYCKASQSESPDVFSNKVSIYVKVSATSPTITDLTGEKFEGDQVRYQCNTSQTRPVAIVTWKLDNLILSNVSNTEHDHGDELKTVSSFVTFTAKRGDNNKTIICETAISGQNNSAKAHETINVHWPPSTPYIITSNLPFLEGQTGKSIFCSSSDYGNPIAKATWITQYGTPNIDDTRRLTFPKLTHQMNQSPVRCRLENLFTIQKGRQILSNQTSLIIEYSPRVKFIVDQKPVTAITINEGERIYIRCTATGNPSPTVGWLGQQFSGPTLFFDNIDRSDHDNYTCRAASTSRSFPSHKFVTDEKLEVVVYYAPTVTVEVGSENPTENMTLHIKCLPEGRPATYYYKTFTHSWGNIVIPKTHRSNNGVLVIQNLSLQDSGTYTCYANNGIRDRNQQIDQSGNSTVKIRVSPKLLVKDNGRKFLGKVGLTTFITVPFYCYPPPQTVEFQFKNGSAITNSSKYTVLVKNGYVKDVFYGQEVGLVGYLGQLQIKTEDESDFVNYTLVIYNGVGSNKSWIIEHFKEKNMSTATKCSCDNCGNDDVQAIVVGIVLGILIVILVTYASYVTILLRRRANKEEHTSGKSVEVNAPTYTNIDNSKNDSREQQCTTDLDEPCDDHYTSLDNQSRDNKNTYDVLSVAP